MSDDVVSRHPLSGPAMEAINRMKDSQGQPPSSGDITYDRILAVAKSLNRVIEAQQYLMDRVPLTGDMPHKEHQKHHRIRQELFKSSETLQVFFFCIQNELMRTAVHQFH